jgi:citrate synthase
MHLRKKHGNHVVSEVKVDDAVLGMRGLPTLYYDGSRLDENQGIVFRGHSVAEFC